MNFISCNMVEYVNNVIKIPINLNLEHVTIYSQSNEGWTKVNILYKGYMTIDIIYADFDKLMKSKATDTSKVLYYED